MVDFSFAIGCIPDCKNKEESYGEICVHCNKCGRFDKEQEPKEWEKVLQDLTENGIRENTVKAKLQKTGMWVYGDLVHAGFDKVYLHPQGNSFTVNDGDLSNLVVMHKIQADTVCRFTGLYDINHTPIFEGDILCYKPTNEYFVVGWQQATASFVLLYPNNSKLIINKDSKGNTIEIPIKEINTFSAVDGTEFDTEIVGNVFDNPELLEGKNEYKLF